MKHVGKVKEAHGLKGELYILVFSGEVSWLPKLKKFELRAKGSEQGQVYTSQKVKPFKNGFIVKPAEVNDRNQSEALKGYDFYIPDEFLVSRPGETIFLNEILNFKIKDLEQRTLGEVIGFSSNGAQDILVVKTENGKISDVPFVEDFISKIDFKNQYIIMDLPEGLIDLDSIE